MSTLLLVDKSAILHRAFYAYNGLQHRGVDTGTFFGFITLLTSYLDILEPDRVVICEDAKPYFRSLIFPKYKSDRAVDKEKSFTLRAATNQVRKFYELCAVPQLLIRGLEADDLMAILACNYEKDFDEILLLSGDTDLYQLLDQENLVMVKGGTKDMTFYGKQQFLNDYPELPECRLWYKVSALTGGHNGLPGVPGIGNRKAASWFGGIAHGLGKKAIQNIKKHEQLTRSMYPITRIPFPKAHNTELIRIPETTCFRENEAQRYLASLGIDKPKAISTLFKLYA